MRTIVMSRTGSPMRWGSPGRTPSGIYLETIAAWNELRARGDCHVAWYGRVDGDSPEDTIRVTGGGLTDLTTARELEDMLAEPEAKLREMDVAAIITVCGARDSWCWPVNDAGAGVRVSAMRFTAPALHACHALDVPRLCVLCDVKCVPHEGEMVSMWPRARPIAILANEDREWDQVVQGVSYACSSVRASTYWPCALPVEWACVTRDLDVAAMHIYHPMMTALPKKNWREEAFTALLASCRRDGLAVGIAGAGWDRCEDMEGVEWAGHLETMEEVMAFAFRGRGGFCVPQLPWHESPKPLWYAMAGAQPLLHRDYPGDFPECLRIGPDGVRAALNRAEQEGGAAWVREHCKPDFTRLHQMVDQVLKTGIVTGLGGFERC